MNIKALIFDLDGTAIPKKPDGVPSPAVINAVAKAKKVCKVSVATGRPLKLCKHILESFQIEDLCILNGGTQVYSVLEEKTIWDKVIDPNTLTQLFTELAKFSTYFVADEEHMEKVPIPKYKTDEHIALPCIFATSREDASEIIQIAGKYPDLNAYSVSSWEDGLFDIHISHSEANKKHAMSILLEKEGVVPEQTMVVGDGGNDLPLFELAGLKVAMGNAADELKERADWIAPSVSEDGLAVAIEKYLLS